MRGRLAAVLAAVAMLGAGCAAQAPASRPAASSSAPAPAPVPAPATMPAPTSAPPSPTAACKKSPGWDCVWQARFDQVTARIGESPGQLSVLLKDRQTGATWQGGAAGALTWTGSTIKLAMVTSVFERARAGKVTLTDADRTDIADMLAWSSDDAADRIWRKFGKDTMVPTFRDKYGMKGLTFVTGFDRYWGFMKCGTADLVSLMSYVLGTLDGTDRAYIVNAMRHVSEIQHWGVWAVGEAEQAGTKNGWSQEKDGGVEHWVTSTVGFVGPNERYALSVMYSMPAGKDSLGLGVHTVSDIAAALFAVPTPVVVVVRPT